MLNVQAKRTGPRKARRDSSMIDDIISVIIIVNVYDFIII